VSFVVFVEWCWFYLRFVLSLLLFFDSFLSLFVLQIRWLCLMLLFFQWCCFYLRCLYILYYCFLVVVLLQVVVVFESVLVVVLFVQRFRFYLRCFIYYILKILLCYCCLCCNFTCLRRCAATIYLLSEDLLSTRDKDPKIFIFLRLNLLLFRTVYYYFLRWYF